ncbi:MAG TPA: hypothetical protein VK524_06550 [Polyangiaceae bacterium]|nr:hypothetical protein [Polyangiaceae bacterium]
MNKGIILSAALACLSCACSSQKSEAAYASSATESGYAERYPDALASLRGRLAAHESKAQQVIAAFSTYPDALRDPNWQDVGSVVERADGAGKSGAYVEQLEENEHVARFHEEEKAELEKKIGGAAQYTVKQKNCDADVYGATTNALGKAVEKQLELRLRAHNEAHRFIADNEDSLGKANVETLQKQADDIAYASYVSHVAAKQTKEQAEALMDEGSEIKKTLDRTISEAQKVEADPARSEGQKRAAHARSEAAQAAKQRVDSEIQQAKYVLDGLDDRSKKLEADYDAAFENLKQRISEKASATPQT